MITFVGVMMVACGPSSGGGGEDLEGSTSVAGDESESGEPTATSGTLPADGSTTGTDPDPTAAVTVTTTPPPDDEGGPECAVPPYVSCDPLAEEEPCDGDQACTFDYHPKGGGFACGCDFGQAGPYEPCESTFDPGDSCAPHQLCRSLASSEDGIHPQCWPLCDSTLCPDDSVCLGGICFAPCDPLAPSTCPDALSCSESDGAFVCSGASAPPDARAQVGEICYSEGSCAHGLTCVIASQLPDCEGSLCCATVCDLDTGEPCVAGQSCSALVDNNGDLVDSPYGMCRDLG
ncbi:MAG: hypothetical protein AAF721_13940 [Myxococcota bacterium]